MNKIGALRFGKKRREKDRKKVDMRIYARSADSMVKCYWDMKRRGIDPLKLHPSAWWK